MKIIKLRWIWGIPFAIQNYECKNGSIIVYIVASTCILMSIVWTADIFLILKKMIEKSFPNKTKPKPLLAKWFLNFVWFSAESFIGQIIYYAGFFVVLYVIPIYKRLKSF